MGDSLRLKEGVCPDARPAPRSRPVVLRKPPLAEKVICWDLDGTLGEFYATYARMNGFQSSRRDGLKPGIMEALNRLSVLGFTHVVTTIAPEKQALKALEDSRLLDFFTAIFCEEQILRDDRKDYSVVAKAFGIQADDYRRRLIAVGDTLPLDINDGGVFIWEPDSPYHTAAVTLALIKLISETGNGDFLFGFRTVFSKAGGFGRPGGDGIDIRIAEGFKTTFFYQQASAVARVRVKDAFRMEPIPLPNSDYPDDPKKQTMSGF